MNTFGRITVRDCVNVAPPSDPRCSDPGFALAYPDICPSVPHLVVKPSLALVCTLGSTQFSAVLTTNGIERDVTSRCVWSSADDTIALIGAGSGNATGVASGEISIVATYGDYTASAELNVMGTGAGDCCSSQTVAMMMLVDTSQSMSQGFGGSYATRLDFAKAAAARFAGEINETKDEIGLISFNDNGVSTPDPLTSDKARVETDVSAIVQTAQLTSFYSALDSAINALSASSADLKVIVLFSDGEDTAGAAGGGYTDADNPISLLSDFKDSGGMVMCLGCRASGGGFALLSAFSTGGFFVNGYPGTEVDALNYISGLKGYVCAGNCQPAGDTMVGTPALNYSAFTNWAVSGGNVDLIGTGMFDFLPGNGLYVDLAGSGSLVPHSGRMVSRTPFSLQAGHQYRVSVDLAGNQRESGRVDTADLKVFYLSGSTEIPLLDHVIMVNDYTQPFQTYAFTFTAPAAVDAYISIQEGDILYAANPNFGLLLDRVTFDDVTDLVNLLTDTFDSENLTYVPPRCGLGTTFLGSGQGYGGFGYALSYVGCYGSGCLDTPPPSQEPDPNPLPSIELGYTPPQVFTSTQTACASCEAGNRNKPVSVIKEVQSLTMTLDTAAAVTEFYFTGYDSTLSARSGDLYDVTLQGSNDGNTWTDLVTRLNKAIVGALNDSSGALDVIFDNTVAYSHYRIVVAPDLPATFVVVYFEAFGSATQSLCASADGVGATQDQADTVANDSAMALARSQLNCVPFYSATETVHLKCPTGTCGTDANVSVTAYSYNSQDEATAEAIAQATELAQRAIDADCTASNNTQASAIADATAGGVGLAANFPMVQYVTGAPTSISSVAVKLYGLTHTWPSDLQMFLRGPDGTCVGIMRHCGGSDTISNVDINFAMGNPVVPDPIVAGTYAPSSNSSGWAFDSVLTPTAPPAPASFNLADFNGKNGNGPWNLWVIDTGVGNTGTIAGGFEVVIA